MQSRNFTRVSILALALTAPVLAYAEPPIINDDSRVGAPPVIVAKPSAAVSAPAASPAAPVVSAPVAPAPAPVRSMPPKIGRPMPPQAAIPVVPPKAMTPPPAVAPPMPRQVMNPPLHGVRGGPDRGGPDRSGPNRRGSDHGRSQRAEAAYQRPSYGYQLPTEWVAPNYFIADYDSYGLSRPASGFGWSRYYDEAVLTDQWGRVYDWRDDVNWTDHDGRYAGNGGGDHEGGDYRGNDDRGPDYRGGDYRDERHDRDDRRHRDKRDKKYAYKGRWTGSWNGGPVQSYQGEWHGSIRPHWSAGGNRGGGYDSANRGFGYGGGYSQSYGYDAGGTTVTTVVVNTPAPVMTTRMISYDVVSYVPVRKKIVRRYKPRPKPACACGS